MHSHSIDQTASPDLIKAELASRAFAAVEALWRVLSEKKYENEPERLFDNAMAVSGTLKIFRGLLEALYDVDPDGECPGDEIADEILRLVNLFTDSRHDIDRLERLLTKSYKQFEEYANANPSQLVSYIEDVKDDNERFKSLFFWKRFSDRKTGGDFISSRQLSDQGIALLSYLYSIKDGCRHQPLFVDCRSSFKHLTNEMLLTKTGTEVTFVQDNVDFSKKEQDERVNHRVAKKIIRTEEGLEIIELDSLNRFSGRPSLPQFYLPCETRQEDGFSCGVFAVKDARFLNSNAGLCVSPGERLPEKLLHSVQNSTFIAMDPFLGNHIQTHKGGKHARQLIVPSKNQEEQKEFLTNNYAVYFAAKHCSLVERFIDENPPDLVISCVRQYDASSITADELMSRFEERQSLERHSDYQKP